MPSNSVVAARILARIAASSHSITVHYPAARVVPTGAMGSPTAPTSLLNPPATTHTLVEAEPMPEHDPVTMSCLWMDAGQWTDTRRNATAMTDYGWVAGAEAMARVSAADANNGKAFLGTDRVVHDGQEYKVISVVPIGAAFAAPATYAVWLKGDRKN